MIDVALKEWAVVCDLLLEGRLTFLLRKGGIHETGGPGVFELEHDSFALFPSWAHQKVEMIQDRYRARVETLDEPDAVAIRGIGRCAGIWRVNERERLDGLEGLHCWTRAQIDMRFDYKPDRPVYLVAVRAYRLMEPKTIKNDREYGGCRSWVALRPDDRIDDSHTQPAVRSDEFEKTLGRIGDALT